MIKTLVPFESVSQFSKIDVAYVQEDPALRPFYKYQLERLSFQKIIDDKSKKSVPRDMLVKVLKEQYSGLQDTDFVMKNIEALSSDKAFTVTTAHQPCLCLGPLYTLYKSFTTINLASAVSGLVHPEHQIVPIFVIGGEDHDLEEMNHIKLFNKKIVWETKQTGSVGAMSTEDMDDVLAQLKDILGSGDYAQKMYARLEEAYTTQSTVNGAIRFLLHDIFGRHGLVVLDMNDARLKRHFIPILKDELLHQTSYAMVTETIEQKNKAGFKEQATPREINLFYMQPGLRERIVLENGTYKVLNTDLAFSQKEILNEVEQHPERFSPNVIMRPLYQETILPNLAYVGGGGELAYWLERKSLFEHYKLNFPLLLRRSSVAWYGKDIVKKLKKYDISYTRFFEDTDSLIRQFVESQAQGEVKLGREKGALSKIFEDILHKATTIDPTLKKAVKAEENKQLAALDQLQSRIHRAEKQKHEVALNQIRGIKEKIFPNNGLQERSGNYISFYTQYGGYFYAMLKEYLKPMEKGMVVLVDDKK